MTELRKARLRYIRYIARFRRLKNELDIAVDRYQRGCFDREVMVSYAEQANELARVLRERSMLTARACDVADRLKEMEVAYESIYMEIYNYV